MQLTTVLTGIVIISASVLLGILGVLIDTQKNPGTKWALFFLLLVCAALGINREYQKEAEAKAEKKRSAEALQLANESSRLVENGLLKQAEAEQKFVEDKEKLEADINANKAYIQSVVEELISSAVKMEEVEKAALKARKKNVAELAADARFETSKKLVRLAKKQEWISADDFKKMAAILKKKEPLPNKELQKIKTKMKMKMKAELLKE